MADLLHVRNKIVDVPGQPEPLSVSIPCTRVRVQAFIDNTGVVAIGPAPHMAEPVTGDILNGPVAATGATAEGAILQAGEWEWFDVADPSQLWIDAAVAGEGVSFMVFG